MGSRYAVSSWLVGHFVNAVITNLQASIDAEDTTGSMRKKKKPRGKVRFATAPDDSESMDVLSRSFDKTPMAGLIGIVDAIGASLPHGA